MRFLVPLSVLVAVSACSKKSETAATTEITEQIAQSSAALALAYPGSLSLAVFPTDTATTLRLEDAPPADDAPPESLKAKEEEAASFLNGTAEHCLPPSLFRPLKRIDETCYEFDQDMIYGTKDSHINGTKNGKSTVTDSSEACLVSFARAQVKAIEQIIDQGLGLQQAMICQAAKDGVDADAASSTTGVDLAKNLTEAGETATDSRKPKITVSEAKMSKDEAGVYRVSINVSITKDDVTNTQTYVLAHVPDSEDNSTYHGVMSITRQEPSNPGNTVTGKRYISVAYTRTAEGGVNKLKTELRSARLATALDAKAFDEDGTLNYNAGADANGNYTGISDPGKAIGNIIQVGFDLNTDDNSGTFEYWQNPGSNYNEAARGMIFKIEKNATSGLLEGCAMSGAALGTTLGNENWMSIRKSLKTETALAITGSFHPFFNTQDGGTCTGTAPETCTKTVSTPSSFTASWEVPAFSVAANVTAAATWAKSSVTPFVIRQCVTQSATGSYEIDTTSITDTLGYMLFNPTNSTDLVIARPDRPRDPPPPPPAPKG